MTTKIAKTAHAATISRLLNTALTGTGITRGSYGYTVQQNLPGTLVEITWYGDPEIGALATIAAALDARYNVTRPSTYSDTAHPALHITPGTPLGAVRGNVVTSDDVAAGPYAVAMEGDGTRPMVYTAAEVLDMITRERVNHSEASINRTTGRMTLHLGKTRTERLTITPATPEQIAAQRAEYQKLADHWTVEAARHQRTADAHRRAKETATAERAYFLESKIANAQGHADGCLQEARKNQDKITALTATTPQEQPMPTAPTAPTAAPATPAEPTTTIKIPGAFESYFDGTSLAQGQDNNDPECHAAYLAWTSARHISTGKGFYIQIEATAAVLQILAEYAGYCLSANDGGEYDATEVRAARTVIERTTAALATLREETAASAPETPQATVEAPTSVWVTTDTGKRIEYAHIPNGDPSRVAHFLTAARAVPTFRDISTQETNSTPITVTWTGTLKGHHNGIIEFPNGAAYKIAHIPNGTTASHTAFTRTPEGRMGEHAARAWTLTDLVTGCATHAGITGPLTVIETGRDRLARTRRRGR